MRQVRTRLVRLAALAAGASLAVGVAAGIPAGAAPSVSGSINSGGQAGSNSQGSTNSASGKTHSAACASVSPGFARCLAQVRTDAAAKSSTPAPAGVSPAATGSRSSATLGNGGAYDPAYLESAYGVFGSSAGVGQTVAIVDAYDDPSAASDLNYYRSYFGLPACSTGCFTKVDEHGGTSYPSANTGWAQEISLDLDMVSAICPNCKILLVEAASASYTDLGTAVNTAAARGAQAISNSYGGAEFSTEDQYSAAYYDHPGIAVEVSSGDNGYGVEFPASSEYVTAVGGTSLQQTNNTGTRQATETAWSGAGSGCSAYEPKPTWQKDTGCTKRTVADVSAVADPNTGVWVYDTNGGGSWSIFGGTSVASPIVASFFALAGQSGTNTATPDAWPYAAAAGSLNDVSGGSNGSCGGSYLCTAVTGYDGPTGLGTPFGTAAFGGSGSGGTNPPPPPPPAKPGSFSLTASSDPSHGVDLSWGYSANVPSASGYTIYRSNSSGTLGSAQSLSVVCGSSGCSAKDTNTSKRRVYYYTVQASNSVGTAKSNQASAVAR